ncbi:MAG: HAD family hydrolase [Rhodospirillales bacterium]|jgi:2-haloalkanoic acid dehalogenase type II
MSETKYQAVIFDLLTALLDSWSFWNKAAGSEIAGLRWRKKYLDLTYGCGAYEDYEYLVEESARQTNVPSGAAYALIESWADLKPWPEAPDILRQLAEKKVPLGVATNCSRTLGSDAAIQLGESAGITFTAIVTAEEAGFYKPHSQPYEMVLDALGTEPAKTLFVAGSPADVPGAGALGMPVYWHNRLGLPNADPKNLPTYEHESLKPLLNLI